MNDIAGSFARAEHINRMLVNLTANKALQAWIHYKSGEMHKAVDYWQKTAHENNDRGVRAKRSLAVYYHNQAYEMETSGQWQQAANYWGKAHEYWGGLLKSEAFRGEIQNLSSVNTSASIDHKDIEPFIEVLGTLLLSPHVTIAQQEFERNNLERTKKHIQILKKSQFPETVLKKALDDILKGICPLKHYGEIDHTTYTPETATEDELRGDFADELFKEAANGPLMLLATLIWQMKLALIENKSPPEVWEKYKKICRRGILDRLDAMSKKCENGMENHLIQSRLQSFIQTGCEFQWLKINNAIGEYNQMAGEFRFDQAKRLLAATTENAGEDLLLMQDLKNKFGCDEETFRRFRSRAENM